MQNQSKPSTTAKQIVVINNSSYSVTNTVNGDVKLILSSGTYTWNYYNNVAVYSYDTLLGYDVITNITDNKTWTFTITNDLMIPGAVVASGTSMANGSVLNNNKKSIGETWESITTMWTTETRTWLAVSQLLTNITKSFNFIWLENLLPWSMLTPWLGTDSEIINQSKP